MPNPWLGCKGLPVGAAAALASLHFAEPDTSLLTRLKDRERRDALQFGARSQLALFLPRNFAPERLEQDAEKNRKRLCTLLSTYRQVADALEGIEFIALKGITQCALFGLDPTCRAQYDIDLYCPLETVEAARDALMSTGYQSIAGMDAFPTDHLPALIRKTTWEWKNDYFDPGIPLSVELHFRFWNPSLERLAAPGVEEFWDRRIVQDVGGVTLNVLAPADALAYASLHLLRHLLRGDARPFHVYEIASFLHRSRHNDVFWSTWRATHTPAVRRLQAVSFRLAERWFGCGVSSEGCEEIERLPSIVHSWFDHFGLSPALQPFRANKDELWLHLSLLESRRDRASVIRRRMLPGNLPPPPSATHLPESAIHWQRRLRLYADYVRYFVGRVRHHFLSLGTTLNTGVRWWWRINPLGREFWLFLSAAVLFNFALFIFFLLYNLWLIDLGYREDMLGMVNSAARLGSLAGTLPAAFLVRRVGIRRALILTIGGTAALTLLRGLVSMQLPVTALSFLEGSIFSVWAVIMGPGIAAAVKENHRTVAFSIFFGVMFATGIAGNWTGGWLPGLLGGKRNTLIAAAILSAVAILPALSLRRNPMVESAQTRIYPRSPFLLRFLLPFAIWHLATGAFNPFNNVYFARLRFSVQEIGSVFSASQVVQLAAVLSAPLAIRRLGLVRGIVWMMFATGCGLGALALQPAALPAVLAYAFYMGFQWMSEPGIQTLLMNHVAEGERSGASAITYLVAFGAQAVAALGAGYLMERFGYGPVLGGAAILAVCAPALLRRLPA